MSNEIVKTEHIGTLEFSQDKVELIKRTICKGATDDELTMFLQVAKRTGLDPFARQIYAVQRYDGKAQRNTMSIQVSIDGFRLVAQRSNEYEGQTAPQWCGEDGVWKDLWTLPTPPYASRVGVWRSKFREPCWGVAKWESYKQEFGAEKKLSPMWKKMPEVMLAKCAESLALRKAFPQELSGLYTAEEMAQATTEKVVEAVVEEKLTIADQSRICDVIAEKKTLEDLKEYFDELKENYSGNKDAMDTFIMAKDARKKELMKTK